MISFELKTGIKEGEQIHKSCVIKQASAGDIIDASTSAEKIVATPNGYQLVVSAVLLDLELLRRQIVKIGSIEGPISMKLIRLLTGEDLGLIQNEQVKLDQAVINQAVIESKKK